MDIKLSTNFLEIFPIQNSLKKHFLFYETLEKVSNKIKDDIPYVEELRTNPELTLLICNVVEEMIPKKSSIDKKLLVVSILNAVFNLSLTQNEIHVIEQQIEYDFEHNKFRRVSSFKKMKVKLYKNLGRFFF
jgi:hypothetical protein